jgi:hypothetical protein
MAGWGTSTPSGVRPAAAAVALGAPKVTGEKGQKAGKMPGKSQAKMPGTYLNKASGKMETAQQMKGYRAPAKAAPQKAPAQAAPAKATTPVFNPLGSGQEDVGVAKSIAQQTGNVERQPLNAEAKQIQQNELGASQRYGKYAEAANQYLGGIAGQQEASAKTFENQAADSALHAGKAVETSGQNAASMTAGFLTPELKAQLNAEGNRESQAGAAGNTFAQNSAQAGQSLMAGIRGSAALKATEGQAKLTGVFQKQAGLVQQKLQGVGVKEGASEAKLAVELPQKQFTNKATASGLGIKVGEAQNKTALAQNTIKSTASKEQSEASKRQSEAAKRQDEGVKTKISLAKLGPEIKRTEAEATQAAAKAKNELHKLAAGGLTTTQQDKYAEQIGAAYSTVQNLRAKGVSDAKIGETLSKGYERVSVNEGGKEKAISVKYPKITNTVLQKAALELWNYHTVSKPTQAALHTLGITLSPQQLAALVGL